MSLCSSDILLAMDDGDVTVLLLLDLKSDILLAMDDGNVAVLLLDLKSDILLAIDDGNVTVLLLLDLKSDILLAMDDSNVTAMDDGNVTVLLLDLKSDILLAIDDGNVTVLLLLDLKSDILLAMDDGNVTVLLLLDLSPAFDTVSLYFNKSLGEKCRNKTLDWFKSYLQNRQCVNINNTKSKSCSLNFAVPQGSLLGPILFSQYTLPLADISKKRCISYHLYADDAQIYVSFRPTNNNENTVCETLNNCVIDIKNWMTANLLQLNTDKTELNIFDTRQMLLNLRNTNIDIAVDTIDVTSCTKNLGVITDFHKSNYSDDNVSKIMLLG